MSNGIYLGKDYHIHREDGYDAALRYLQRKKEEHETDHLMASIVGWVIGTFVIWGIVLVMYYNF